MPVQQRGWNLLRRSSATAQSPAIHRTDSHNSQTQQTDRQTDRHNRQLQDKEGKRREGEGEGVRKWVERVC